MRKSLLLSLLLVFSASVFAQSRLSFIEETFGSDGIPTGWSIMDLGQENWSRWPTNMAGGGSGGEIKLNWNPPFDGTTRLVTPAINTTGLSNISISFKGYLDNYQDSHKIGVATTSDGGTTWNVAWEDTFDSSLQGQHSFEKTVSTSDIGKENVQLCIFYTGDSNNLNSWYFDDINVFSSEELNLSLVATSFPNIIGINGKDVTINIHNTGTSMVESFEASYQVDDETPVVETFSANIASTETGDFTFQEQLSLTPGQYTLTLTILSVNGGEDLDMDNVITKEFEVAIGETERKPLIEHFSSSTCGPCVYTNQAMATLTANNPDKYSYVKYPVNFPGIGDPYCIGEGLLRMIYYGVTYAPQLFLDGVGHASEAISDQELNAEYNTAAFVDIKGAFNIQDNIVNVTVDVTGLVDISSVRLYIAVNEKTTTGNVGSNGETEFHHIVMTMSNYAEGQEVEVKAGENERYEYSLDMTGTNVEEMSDLEVVAWIQNHSSREVYNSRFMYEYTEHPFPVQNMLLTKNDNGTSYTVSWDAPEQGNPIGYNVYVNDNLRAENITEFSYLVENSGGLNVVKVVAVYENGKKSVAVYDMIDMGEGVSIDEVTEGFNLYPNPVEDMVKISSVGSQISVVKIYNVMGMMLEKIEVNSDEAEINVSDYAAGVYFFNVDGKTVKVIKD